MMIRRSIDRRAVTASGVDTKDIPEFMSIINDLRAHSAVEIYNADAYVCQHESHNKIYYIVHFAAGENHNNENDMVLGWYGPNRSKVYKKKVDICERRYHGGAQSIYRQAADDKRKKNYKAIAGFKAALTHALFNTGSKTSTSEFITKLKDTRLGYD